MCNYETIMKTLWFLVILKSHNLVYQRQIDVIREKRRPSAIVMLHQINIAITFKINEKTIIFRRLCQIFLCSSWGCFFSRYRCSDAFFALFCFALQAVSCLSKLNMKWSKLKLQKYQKFLKNKTKTWPLAELKKQSMKCLVIKTAACERKQKALNCRLSIFKSSKIWSVHKILKQCNQEIDKQ